MPGKPIILQKSFNLKSRSRDLGHAPLGSFDIRWLVAYSSYGRTSTEKNDMSLASVQKLWRARSQNLKSRSHDTGHAHSGVIHHPLCSTRHGYVELTEKNEVSIFIR